MTPVFTIMGARGSRPVCDPAFQHYGGNTTCFLLETAEGSLLIDAGTGLSRFDPGGPRDPERPIAFIFTHFHLDHLAGLPAARFLYRRDTRIRFFADPQRRPTLREALSSLLTPPFWPVTLDHAGAVIEYADLMPDGAPILLKGISVSAMALRHPQGSMGLRLEWPGCRIVVATDHEPGDPAIDAALTAFAGDADYLLMDAQFPPEQRCRRRGWGHGDWSSATALAHAARVRHLVLIHHDPQHDDSAMAALEADARQVFPPTMAAREGLRLPLPDAGSRMQ